MTIDPLSPPPNLQPGLRKHFGRLKRFDERSLDHSIRRSRLSLWRTLTARIRTRVNHRVFWQGNQGATAECTAYGILHMWEAGKAHARTSGPLRGIGRPIIAPNVIYRRAQELDPWPGSESVSPLYEGSSGTAAAKAAQEAGLITGYDWEFDDIDVCARAIFTGPLGFGVDWFGGMMLDGQPRTRWEDAVIRPFGPFIGGHFLAAVGYDKRRKNAEFELLNSWGKKWGFNGRCYISKTDLGELLSAQGESVMLRDSDDAVVLASVRP